MPEANYIECMGVRVPADWSVEQVAASLVKRHIRFSNEAEIMRVFGEALCLKAALEHEVTCLKSEVEKLNALVEQRKSRTLCPGCGARWTNPTATASPKVSTPSTPQEGEP